MADYIDLRSSRIQLLAKLVECRTVAKEWPAQPLEYRVALLEKCIDEITDYLRSNPT